MKHITRAILTLLAAVVIAPQLASADELAETVKKILQRNCVSCHGLQQKVEGFDVRSFASVANYVERGDPDNSELLYQVEEELMPPGKNPKLNDDETEAIRQWILDGPTAFDEGVDEREFVSEAQVQIAIEDYFLKNRELLESDLRHQRFFTFHNLHNNRSISNDDLQLYKAALSKALNSLSWESEIVVPRAIDPQETVYVFDLRDLDWTEEEHWNELLKVYPYAIDYRDDRELKGIADNVQLKANNAIQALCMRADWFVNNATRTDLYHTLLELPESKQDLEEKLEVQIVDDFNTGRRLLRGGVLRSGVSNQNRILDRHNALTGYYWISYDFKVQSGTGDIRTHPLGPVFEEHPFPDEAFEHDGGEIIFSLPNGLQGYYLTDNEGNRINEGPIEIVADDSRTSGTQIIINGLSCINCHKTGMREFTDVVRRISSDLVDADASEKVRDLYPTNERMNQRLQRDSDRFLEALAESVKGFIPSDKEYLQNLPVEPVGAFARWYQGALDLDTIKADLGRKELTPGELQDLRRIGVSPGISRDNWDQIINGGNSGFQKACVELRIGAGFTFNF